MAFVSVPCTTLEFGCWLFRLKQFDCLCGDGRQAFRSGNDSLYLSQFCSPSGYFHLVLTDYASPCGNLMQFLLPPNFDSE